MDLIHKLTVFFSTIVVLIINLIMFSSLTNEMINSENKLVNFFGLIFFIILINASLLILIKLRRITQIIKKGFKNGYREKI